MSANAQSVVIVHLWRSPLIVTEREKEIAPTEEVVDMEDLVVVPSQMRMKQTAEKPSQIARGIIAKLLTASYHHLIGRDLSDLIETESATENVIYATEIRIDRIEDVVMMTDEEIWTTKGRECIGGEGIPGVVLMSFLGGTRSLVSVEGVELRARWKVLVAEGIQRYVGPVGMDAWDWS